MKNASDRSTAQQSQISRNQQYSIDTGICKRTTSADLSFHPQIDIKGQECKMCTRERGWRSFSWGD